MSFFPDPAEWMKKFLEYNSQKRISVQKPVFGVQTETDIPYLQDGDPVHTLDIYRPKMFSGLLPVILTVHGGAWIGGSKEDCKNFGIYLASKGFAVVNVNYTLAQNDHLRTQVEDILCCFRWMQDNGLQYTLDLNAVFLCAVSTGAQLALLSYIVDHSELLQMLYHTKSTALIIRGIGLITPVIDLHPFQKIISISKCLYGAIPKESPYYYCSSVQDVLTVHSPMPPIIIVGAEEDPFFSTTRQTHHLLNKRNVPHTFRVLPKGEQLKLPHAFCVHYPEYAESMTANNLLLAFFQQQLDG